MRFVLIKMVANRNGDLYHEQVIKQSDDLLTLLNEVKGSTAGPLDIYIVGIDKVVIADKDSGTVRYKVIQSLGL